MKPLTVCRLMSTSRKHFISIELRNLNRRVPDSVPQRQPKHLVRQTTADPKPVRFTGYAQTAALVAAGRQHYNSPRNPWFYSQRFVRGKFSLKNPLSSFTIF